MLQTIEDEMLHRLEDVMSDSTIHPVNRNIAKFWVRVFRKEFDKARLGRLSTECHTLIAQQLKVAHTKWLEATRADVVHMSFEEWMKERVIGLVIPGDIIAVPFEGHWKPVMPCGVAESQTYQAIGHTFRLKHINNNHRNVMVVSQVS
jgi:hypothetical protein